MTRQDAEKKIAKKVKEIRKIMETYDQNWSGYLGIGIVNGHIQFNNSIGDDTEFPIDYFE